MGRRFWWSTVLVAAMAIALPLLGTWARRQRLPQCALDGVPIVSTYSVEIAASGQPRRGFCCIRCAAYWLEKEPSASVTINVTDEVTGQPVHAAEAIFVRSTVITNPVTQNDIHAFADRDDAEQHAAQFRGRLLEGDDRPFR